MLKAKDIMSKNVVSVKKDTPIFEAVQILVEQNISGLPVVEENMTLAGILSEKDVVDLFYESENAENKTVNDYMTDPAFHFEENSDLKKICNFLLKNIFRRVPITSDGKLIGIISIKDVLYSVLQRRRNKEDNTD
ncbi:MAG: CBS domain-containing protein [Planctomycetota bacterium]